MQFKITLAIFLILTLGLLWWSSHQYQQGYAAGRDSAQARCLKNINSQAQALQSAMHQARVDSRERLRQMERVQQDERDRLNRQIRHSLQTDKNYKRYYQTPTPPAVLDSIYGVQ